MPIILNYTPFSAARFILLDQHCRQLVLVVLNATFEARPGRRLQVAEQQVPILDTDVYYGEPGLSSVQYEADVALEKTSVDVVVNGQAFATGGRKASAVPVGIRVGDLCKQLIVCGDRYWGLLGPSFPEPFETMPIIYERAFGGIDTRPSDPKKRYADPRNPIGVGFRRAHSLAPDVTTELPNIEYPGRPTLYGDDRSEPAGLGIVSRAWLPRVSFAGTYDDEWQRSQCPLLPLDFDPRYYQASPLDQQSTTIKGGEAVEVTNMTPEGLWQFILPQLDVPLRLVYEDRHASANLILDTILIEPEKYRFVLKARAKVPVLRNKGPLREIVIGHVTPGWWRARLRRKRYIDYSGRGGRTDIPSYTVS